MSNWSNKRIIQFIEEVHSRPELWNINFAEYRNRNIKRSSWEYVGNKFGINSEDAYKKFRNLRTYAKNCFKKKNGSDASTHQWFAMDAISFTFSSDAPEIGFENEVLNITESNSEDCEHDNYEIVETFCSLPIAEETAKKKNHKTVSDKISKKAIKEINDYDQNKYSSFGIYVARKLNEYDDDIQINTEFKINKLLYEADMKMLNRKSRSSTKILDDSIEELFD